MTAPITRRCHVGSEARENQEGLLVAGGEFVIDDAGVDRNCFDCRAMTILRQPAGVKRFQKNADPHYSARDV
jgi:hypothetical protein